MGKEIKWIIFKEMFVNLWLYSLCKCQLFVWFFENVGYFKYLVY